MTNLNERRLLDAWNDAYAADEKPRRTPRLRGRGGRARTALVAAGLMGVIGAPAAIGATGDALREGQRNGTATKETSIIANVRGTSANTGGFSTRQSNTSTTGGGAVYGCRSNTTAVAQPCVRGNNLSTGLAFSFSSQKGAQVGEIRVAGGGDTKRPFVTNATGVATGLNADRVDGKDAAQIAAEGAAAGKSRWALVNAAGQIEAQSGGFTVKSAYAGNPAGATDNVYIDAGQDLTSKAITATVALQNQVDQDGDGATNGRDLPGNVSSSQEFGGEISATRCAITGVVACAPPGTNDANHFVVSPRNSDGGATSPTTRKRFYVTIAG